MPLPNLTEVAELGWIAVLGILARLSHWIKNDTSVFRWRALFYEIPTGAVFGVVGKGLADYLDVNKNWQEVAVIVAFGYLGPRIGEIALEKLREWKPPFNGGR